MRPATEPNAASPLPAADAETHPNVAQPLRPTQRSDVPAVMLQLFEHLEQRRIAWLKQEATESVPLDQLSGRCLAQPIVSPVNLPAFRRAMMDGVATDSVTLATAANQLQILSPTPESASTANTAPAVVVSTGGRVPDWADAVVPIEWLRNRSGETVTADELPRLTHPLHVPSNHAVRPQQHVASIGEDVRFGQVLLDNARPIRPQDVALLAACGLDHARCRRQPRVALAITGNEVTAVGTPARGDQVHDANGPVLQNWVRRDGASLASLDYLPDDLEKIQNYLRRDDVDVIVLCGGTSVGRHDHAATALAAAGQVTFHGLPLRPGRPVVVGHTHSASVFLLPGNPIACQFTYDLLVGPLLRSLAGQPLRWPYRCQPARLAAPVTSHVGRLDYLRVTRQSPTAPLPSTPLPLGPPTLTTIRNFPQSSDWGAELNLWDSSPADNSIPWVWPLTSGRASNLTSVSQADGFVLVPWDRAELHADETLDVFWYDA